MRGLAGGRRVEDHLAAVDLAAGAGAASFSSLSVNHFSGQRSHRCKTADYLGKYPSLPSALYSLVTVTVHCWDCPL